MADGAEHRHEASTTTLALTVRAARTAGQQADAAPLLPADTPTTPRDTTATAGGVGVRIDCSGWSYDDWRRSVYADRPAREWLQIYSRLFPTVEVNSTFYRLPRPETVARWVAVTASGFTFSIKVSRYLTHIRRLRDVDAGLDRLLQLLRPLIDGGRLEALLWQLPPDFRRDDGLLADWLGSIPAGLPYAIEFRHHSWFCLPVYDLLSSAAVTLVEADDRRRPPWPAQPATGRFRYLRMHHGDKPSGAYSDGALGRVAAELLGQSPTRSLVYFNNDWDALAVADAASLRSRVRAAAAWRASHQSEGYGASGA
jgi:uncharacterized protein YecE (DUF72 family)